MWMRVLVCLFAIAAASASGGWESGTKYTYNIRGRTLTALHQVADQYAGILTKASLEIIPKSQNQLFAKLNNAQFAKVEKILPGGWSSYIPEDQLTYEPLPVSSKPIEIRLKGGVIEEFDVDASLPNWEINMIKGVISQLQMDLKGKNLVESPENQLPSADDKNGVFKTMEQAVTGRCEIQYDVSVLPEYILQSRPELAPLPELRKDGDFIDVVKSTNFSRCEKRPYYNFGFPGRQRLQLASNRMGDAIVRSSVSRAVLSGKPEKYTIQSSVTTHKTIISPNLYDNQKGMIVSRMNVTLNKYTKVTEQPVGPENPRKLKDLTYRLSESLSESSMDSQNSSEEQADSRLNNAARRFRRSLQKQRPAGEENNWSMELKQEYKQKPNFDEPRKTAVVFNSAVEKKLVNPVRSAISLAKQIGEDLQNPSAIPEKATLSKFTTLALIARAMNTKQIQDVVHELYIPATHSEPASHDNLLQRAAWKAWRDAVAQAGTSPALVNMKEWMVKGMVYSMEAGHMLETLTSAARYPDKEYIHYLFRLAEHPQIKKDHTVYTAALFAFTTLLRLAHVDKVAANDRYPAYLFGQLNLNDETRVDRYVDYYAYRLKKAVEKEDSVKVQTYISILGNIGHPRVLKRFEPFLEGEKSVTPFQRKLMLVSLYNMEHTNPKLFRAAAYRIYQSASEDAQIRSLAAYFVLESNPPAAMIQRMAESTNFEQNEQVRSAVKTMIESLATLKAGEDWERIANAKAAVKNLNSTSASIHFSQGLSFSKDIEDMQMSLRSDLYTIGKEDSLLPQSLFAFYGGSFNGLKMNHYGLGLMASSIQNLYEAIFNNEKPEPLDNSSEVFEHPLWSHNGVANLLRVINNQSEPIEANLRMSSGVSQRFFAFDNKTIEHLRSAYKHVWSQLQRGEMKFNHSRLFTSEEIILTIPTPMGIPTTFKMANPAYYSIRGKVNVMTEPQQEQSEKMPATDFKGVSSDIHYVVSSKSIAQLSIVTPFDNKRYQAGIEKDMQINIPAHSKIEFDRENNEIRAMLQPTHPDEKINVVIVRSRPYTSQEDMLKMEPARQNIIHVRKPIQSNLTFGQEMTGMAFEIDYSSERQFMDFAEAIRKVQKGQIVSAFLQSVAEPIQHCELIVSYNPEKSSAKSVNLSAAYEKMKNAQGQDEQRGQTDEQKEKEIEQLIKNEEQETEQEWSKDLSQGHSWRQEILTSILNKINGSDASLVQLTAKFNGQKEAKFVATAAVANSPVSEYSHAEIHLHQSPVNQENNKHIAVHFTSKMPLPPMTNYRKALEARHKARLDTVIILRGKDLSAADKPAVIHIRTDLKQNEEQREFVLTNPMAKLCNAQMKEGNDFLPACQNITLSANMMNEFDTRIQYKGISDEFKNATYKAFSFARFLGWEYYSENALNANNKENAVRVHARFAPDEESVNVTIASPTMNGLFKNIRLSPLAAAAVIPHAVYTPPQMVSLRLLRDNFYPSCVINKKAVNTYNNLTYPLDIESSWHVAFHTSFQQPARQLSQLRKNATVLIRRVGTMDSKELRILLGGHPKQNPNVIEFIPSGKSVEVKVNNETVRVSSHRVSEFRDENNHVFARMYATPDKTIRVTAPNHPFEIFYRSNIIVISAANSLRNQVRGLCGTFSSEIATDFTTPKNCIVKKSEHFVASWAVMATGKDAQRQLESQQVPCFPKTHRFANVVTEWEDNSNSNGSSEEVPKRSSEEESIQTTEKPNLDECTIKVTGVKVIKIEDQICFSRRPQIFCKPHCQANTKMEMVEFYCLPHNSSAARHYQLMIKRGVTPDLAQKASSRTLNVPVIESCQP